MKPDAKTPVAGWHADHVYFQRLLHLLHKEVDVFHGGERPNYELMLDIITYLREYTDRFHHPREDAAFAFIVRRFPDMQLALARLQQEHRVIAQAGDVLLRLLGAALEGEMVPRNEIEMAAATYLVYYGNHIAKEEEDVLTRAALALSPEEWEAVRKNVPHGQDPLFGSAPEERFRELRRRIALEA
jgi:hemerythrin-like domain-containing protein